MCTIILIVKLVPGYPLVLAANRDEFLDRGFSAPQLWPENGITPRIFAGKDEKEGGTWMGINEHGVAVGIANRHTGTKDPGKRSRGQVVLDCLNKDSLKDVEGLLGHDDLGRYNPFTLFCCHKGDARSITNYPETRIRTLGNGVHVITNCDPEDHQDQKKIYIQKTLASIPDDLETLRKRLMLLCADHSGPQAFPFPVCVHLDGYGTVSSCIVMVGDRLDASRFYYCEGHPCKGDYKDLTPSFMSLFR